MASQERSRLWCDDEWDHHRRCGALVVIFTRHSSIEDRVERSGRNSAFCSLHRYRNLQCDQVWVIPTRSTWQSRCVLRGFVGVGVMRHANQLAQIIRGKIAHCSSGGIPTPSNGIPGNFLFSLRRTWDQHLYPGLMLLKFTTTQPSRFRFADTEQNSTTSLSATS